MGCDIHMRVEFKSVVSEKWEDGDLYMRNRYYYDENGEPVEGEKEFEVDELYPWRHYGLFSLLADVRNYHGVQPISEPKGVPDDCCKSTKDDIEWFGIDGHSHSYLTLSEMKEACDKRFGEEKSWLLPLVDALEKRGIKLFKSYYGDVQKLYEPLKEIYRGLDGKPEGEEIAADRLRIVFWFDN